MAILSIPAAYRRLVAAAPDRTAIACDGEIATRAALEAAAEARARDWHARGVGEGDRIAIALPNGIPFFECVLAAWKLGAVPIPLSSRLPEPEHADATSVSIEERVLDDLLAGIEVELPVRGRRARPPTRH